MDGLKGLFPINESSTFLSINWYRNKYLWRTWAIYEHIRWLFHRLHTSVGESSCKLCPSPLNTSIWYLPSSSITGTLQGDIYPAYEQSSWACRACLFLQEPITCIQEQSKTDCPFPCTNLQNKERDEGKDLPSKAPSSLNWLSTHTRPSAERLDQAWIHRHFQYFGSNLNSHYNIFDGDKKRIPPLNHIFDALKSLGSSLDDEIHTWQAIHCTTFNDIK